LSRLGQFCVGGWEGGGAGRVIRVINLASKPGGNFLGTHVVGAGRCLDLTHKEAPYIRRLCLRGMYICPVHLFVISSTAEVSSRIQNRELRYS
jgi:hypothetical protein